MDVDVASTPGAMIGRPRLDLTVNGHDMTLEWGTPDELGSAAFWIHQTRSSRAWIGPYRLGSSLGEELSACILGGYGVPGGVGVAAFEHLRGRGVFDRTPPPPADELALLLREPIVIEGRERPVHYRFWRQRSRRLHNALLFVQSHEAPTDPLELRSWLCCIDGVGLKTASWVVRNHLNSDAVAIVDIHIQRAGVAAQFFEPRWRLPRDYLLFEAAFIQVARLGGVRVAALDACIWSTLSNLGSAAETILGPDYVGLSRGRRAPTQTA